jgi:antitoxin (DNA-binding transcriptional repressor) of toxin-antitoxin stability system
VRRGEIFLVTDRDTVVAELRPPGSAPGASGDELDRAMDALAAAGEVQRARASRDGWTWSPRGLGLPPGTASALLDVLRSERGGSG